MTCHENKRCPFNGLKCSMMCPLHMIRIYDFEGEKRAVGSCAFAVVAMKLSDDTSKALVVEKYTRKEVTP